MTLGRRPRDATLEAGAFGCALFVLDAEGRVQAANEAFAALVQQPLAVLQGQPLERFLAPGARAYHRLVLEPALHLQGRADEVSLALRAADGSDTHVLASIVRRAAGAGEPDAAPPVEHWALMRLRQRKELEDQLLAARRAAAQLPGVLFRLVLGPDGRYRMPYAGAQLADLVDIDPATLVDDAAPLFARLHPEDRAAVRAAFERGVYRGAMEPLTTRLLHDGRVRWLRVHASVESERDGSHVWHGALYDVTQQHETDARLRELDKLQAVATLAAGVAHDFNNLLGSITGLAELAELDAPDGSRQARHLGRILQAARTAAGLVRQLLDFSRQSPQSVATTSVALLLARAEALLGAGMPPGVALGVELREDSPVRLDAVQIEQVLMNLVNNAAHASRKRGGAVRVIADRHRRSGEPAMARLRVIDRGDGIAPELLDKIFEPFFTTKPVGEGTGLGLAAVHGIVTRHGGRVQVESTPGLGSTFTVLLPIASDAAVLMSPHDSSLPS